MELLLKEPGTDVNMRDRDGWTLVTTSVKYDLTPSELTKLQFLVTKANADVTVKDFIGWNAVGLSFILSLLLSRYVISRG